MLFVDGVADDVQIGVPVTGDAAFNLADPAGGSGQGAVVVELQDLAVVTGDPGQLVDVRCRRADLRETKFGCPLFCKDFERFGKIITVEGIASETT